MSTIITIDGPAGSGKSTVSKQLAGKLGYTFLDTGAMYRAVTWAGMRSGVDLNDTAAMTEVINSSNLDFQNSGGETLVTCRGEDISDEIRSRDVTEKVNAVAANPQMRNILVKMQRDFAARHGSIVTEGRDQGTVVFPDAMFKFFLDATLEERSIRRYKEFKAKGIDYDLDEIKKSIEKRDNSDIKRSSGPLKPADDAVRIDTSEMSVKDVVGYILNHIKSGAGRV
ncbi:Cytidylate kinase [Limihaloglobus sulfuriphilus]|uniref:Cytidylate kinase n=1 Tax=Limihaloglobus sulfuriphilus TaxID=1851148 RepID=A0A1Q2MBQ9_9BACT|nr:(d)CMP kinase [Limihaloglobus sulfuriphilus]AQQ70136.1 Cytidylate kinase [Limihaloglobus sulfuriphilus]